MKQLKLSCLLALLLSAVSVNVMADIVVDGISYYFFSGTEAEVTHYNYAGDVVIPSKVKYGGKEYLVTRIGDKAFNGSVNMTSITIPESIREIGNDAFYNCTGLQKVIVSDISAWCRISFYITKVSTISYSNPLVYAHRLFSSQDAEITDLVIPNGVTEICALAFEGCSSLKTIKIPNSVLCIGDYAFSKCSNLTELFLPDGVQTLGEYAFYGCYSLQSVSIPKSLTNIKSRAFMGCTKLQKVIVNDIASWCNVSFGFASNPLEYAHHLYNEDIIEVTDLLIPEGVKNIADRAFEGCEGLQCISLPNTLNSVGEYSFSGCNAINSVYIPQNVLSIGYKAFEECSIASMTIESTSLLSQSYLHEKLGKVGELIVGENVESIGDRVFYGSSLKAVKIPASIKSIGEKAFVSCDSLVRLEINSKEILSATNTGIKTFFGNQLQECIIGGNINVIGDNAFRDCSALTSVIFPSSVTTIGNYAFYGCSDLTSLAIPASVTSIGEYNQEIKGETNVEIIPVSA